MLFRVFMDMVAALGRSVLFLGEIFRVIVTGRIRWGEVFREVYAQGVQSLLIVALASLASGAVLAMQGIVVLERFGAKEFITHLVALSLVRELGPVFTALVFSGKSGAGMAAELATMSVNDQVRATRAMGVDPVGYLVVPRFVACGLVLPLLVVMAELVGIFGGYLIGVGEAGIPAALYLNQTAQAVRYLDFFSGFSKVFFFSFLISWICCYQGFTAGGGSLGVGRATTRAVAMSYVAVILANTVLTKIILMVWG